MDNLSLFDRILPNLNLKNMISNLLRIFHEKNSPNWPDFKEKEIQIAIFLMISSSK
jgi:hypothetical protein